MRRLGMRIHHSPGVPERRKTRVEYDQWHPEMFTSSTRQWLVSTTLRGLGLFAVLAGGAYVIFSLQPFGRREWAFGAVLAALVWLALNLLRRPFKSAAAGPGGHPSRWRVDRLIKKVSL